MPRKTKVSKKTSKKTTPKRAPKQLHLFGDDVLRGRKKHKLTRMDLAVQLDMPEEVGPGHVRSWEVDGVVPPAHVVAQVSKALSTVSAPRVYPKYAPQKAKAPGNLEAIPEFREYQEFLKEVLIVGYGPARFRKVMKLAEKAAMMGNPGIVDLVRRARDQ
jgi:DNA-binding transcriptional regulator YiaG